MDLATLLAELRATRRFPTEAEAELVAREGTPVEVAEVMVRGCCLHYALRARYIADRREGN